MKTLIRKMALFLVGLLFCLVAASVYYELRVRQQDDFYRQVADFKHPSVQPTVLLVGDSRMAVGIDPGMLPDGVYNFSYPGETLRHVYLRIRYALETKPSIEYIVLGLEDVQFSDARAHLTDAVEQLAFADLVALTEIYPSSPAFLLRHAVLHYLPLVNANYRRRAWDTLLGDLQSLVFGSAANASTRFACGGARFVRNDIWSQMTESQRLRYARKDVDRLLGGSAANPEMRAVFRRIVDLAHAHGVQVLGLRSPVSGAYLEAALDYYEEPPLGFLEPEDLDGLLDYVDMQIDAPDKFYDADHLNEAGAAEFTERLITDLREIGGIETSQPRTCERRTTRAKPTWPYHDVLSSWLTTPSCHNLSGTCGNDIGPVLQEVRNPASTSGPQRARSEGPASVRKVRGVATRGDG